MTGTWALPLYGVPIWTTAMRKALRKAIVGGKSLSVTPGICLCCCGVFPRNHGHIVVRVYESTVIARPHHEYIGIGTVQAPEPGHRPRAILLGRQLRNPPSDS